MIRGFQSFGKSIRSTLKTLRDNRSGMAMIEFAYSLPLLTTMIMAGGELTNFTTVRMRISQLTIHVADNAARMGSGSLLSVKTISETQINDLFTGANLQGGKLNLLVNGRIILTELENDTANTGKYRIFWARCKGAKNSTSAYWGPGSPNTSTNPNTYTAISNISTGITINGQTVTAPSGGSTMIAEIYYNYQPIVSSKFAPKSAMNEVAAMTVRDQRDLTAVYNTEGATKSGCATFSST